VGGDYLVSPFTSRKLRHLGHTSTVGTRMMRVPFSASLQGSTCLHTYVLLQSLHLTSTSHLPCQLSLTFFIDTIVPCQVRSKQHPGLQLLLFISLLLCKRKRVA